jgi:hypothetical protein
MSPDDPLLAHTGSAESAALLRRNLLAIADQHRGTPMARAVREVLAGRRDLADLEREADFMQLMRGGVAAYEDHLASLSPEEKERLYTEAHEIADADEQDRT